MHPNYYCVIMAGGVGSRLWPASNHKTPKQFLDLLQNGTTLLQQTFKRACNLVNAQNIYVVTSKEHKQQVQEQLTNLKDDQILCEPTRCNTAACIAYACYKIHQQNPNAVLLLAASDHFIGNENLFTKECHKGFLFAEQGSSIVTLGVKPAWPETGYGYIQTETLVQFNNYTNLFKVKKFVEKPSAEIAQFFLENGDFFWNSGMFISTSNTLKAAFEKHMPEMHTMFEKANQSYNTQNETTAIEEIYKTCQQISIDYGIMEKYDNVYMLGVDFGWSDLGSWGSLCEHFSKDLSNNATCNANAIFNQAENTFIYGQKKKLIVASHLKNYLVIDTPEALLIIPKDEEKNMRSLVELVKQTHQNQYL